MYRMTLIAILAILITVSAVSAAEREIEPTKVIADGGIVFPEIVYEYTRHSGETVIRLDTNVFSWGFWPVDGELEMADDFDLALFEGQLTFPFVEETYDPNDNFEPVSEQGWYHDQQTVGFTTNHGDVTFQLMFFEDVNAWGYAEFEAHLPTFDFDESVCELNNDELGFRFSVHSFEELPGSIDYVEVTLQNGRSMVFENLPLQQGGGDGFDKILVPMKRRRYESLLSEQKLQTTFIISGETVTWEVFYPHPINAASTCQSG